MISMNIGVRSYANSIYLENIFRQQAMPDSHPALKAFSTKILTPTIKVVTDDCRTLIGRNVSADDDSMLGLLALDTNTIIDDAYLVDKYQNGIYTIRVRDTCACTATGGVCRKCLHGTYVRLGMTKEVPAVGETVQIPTQPSSILNAVASMYGGSLIGVAPVPADPLPIRRSLYEAMMTHDEMDTMVRNLSTLKIPSDELDYLQNIHDRFERAIMIVAYYGVYGNASIK